jgi:hypothetical protein
MSLMAPPEIPGNMMPCWNKTFYSNLSIGRAQHIEFSMAAVLYNRHRNGLHAHTNSMGF